MGAGASSGVAAAAGAASAAELAEIFGSLPGGARAKLHAALLAVSPPTLDFAMEYGVYGTVDCADIPRLIEIFEPEAQAQVLEEPRAPRFTFLGLPTPSTGYPPVPEALTKSRIFWVAYFEDRDAYHVDHLSRESNKVFAGEFVKTLRDGMASMMGSYRGRVWHLESLAAPLTEPTYCTVSSAKAKDAEAAGRLIAIIKAHAPRQLSAEPGALRYTLIPPMAIGVHEGDMPPEIPREDRTVMWVEAFKTAADHEAHKSSRHLADLEPKIAALVEDPETDTWTMEFAGATHFAKLT